RGQGGGPRGARGARGARGHRQGADRGDGAERRAPVHQPALPAEAGGAAGDPRGLMADGALATREETTREPSPAARKRPAKQPRPERGRWVREAKGILALALAGFGMVAIWSFDPRLHPLDQSSPVGPVGGWLGAASFWAVGYAGYLLPVLLAVYGVSAFVCPRLAPGGPAGGGPAILLLGATGIFARASDTASIYRIHRGGVLGWAVSETLRLTVGTVGTWIVLLALLPVGVLFVTQISYGVLSRALGARYARRRTSKGRPAEP